MPYARHQVDEADLAAVVEAMQGDWLTQGPWVARFEEAVAAFCGAPHAVAFASGTAALQAAYCAAGVGPQDEVVTTPLTFAATVNAAVLRGARPIFVDVRADTLNLDVAAAARVDPARIRAIVPVDFAGLPCDYEALLSLARSREWLVIQDAAHSFGAAAHGRRVGTLADLTVFSFHPAKAITSGEGGMVVTHDAGLAARLRRVRHHGIEYRDAARPWDYSIAEPGLNARLTDFQCALGCSQLAKAEKFLARRAALAERYRARLAGSPFLSLPALPDGVSHAWHLFVVLLELDRLREGRDRILMALRAENIGVHVHYPLVHLLAFYRQTFGTGEGLCPVAERLAPRLMTLPLFPAMSEEDQDDVLTALDKVLTHFAR